MAEVTARKRGTKWEYRFEMALIKGKRKQFSKSGFATKKEALKAGADAYAKYNRAGFLFEPSEISVADYFTFWYENYIKMHTKVKTQQTYDAMIRTWIIPKLGTYHLRDITPAILTAWINEAASKLSKSSLEVLRAIVSGAMSYAVVPMGFIESSPAIHLRLPEAGHEKRITKAISLEDYQAICKELGDHRIAMAFIIGWECGLRVGEATSLTWADIDIQERIMHIRSQVIHHEDGYDYLDPLKTSAGVRDIIFSSRLAEALLAEKARQQNDRHLYGDYYMDYWLDKDRRIHTDISQALQEAQPLDFICRRENGKRFDVHAVENKLRRIKKKLGIDFRFHSLRHSHASILAEAGAPVKAVQERLGHSNIQTTLNIYTHVSASMRKETADIFDRIMTESAHT